MGKPGYTIRNADESDVLAILKMHAQSWLDTYPNEEAGVTREWVQGRVDRWFTDENIEKRRQRARESQHNKDMLYMVAEGEKGEIIGIICPFRDDTTQRVGSIYVDKAYQGTGLAQKLMDHIIAWADPHRPIELEVASYNERAKAFYRRYNFEEVEHSEHTAAEKIPVITMIRKGDKQ